MHSKPSIYCFPKLFFSLLLIFPLTLLAWTPGLKEMVDLVAAGKATQQQEMFVFFNNKEVNLMAEKGVISRNAYQNVQTDFHDLNQIIFLQSVGNNIHNRPLDHFAYR